MIHKVTMPKLGLTMTKGTITQILVQDGDRVNAGQVLMQIETDKISHQIEAPVDGYVRGIQVAKGDEVDVTSVLCNISEYH